MSAGRRAVRAAVPLAVVVVGALTAWLYRDVLAAGGGVFRVTASPLERADQLLHAWTLDWVWHALVHRPGALFRANAFHPQPLSLALSDHLVGVAVTLWPLRLVTDDPLRVNALGTLCTFVLAGAATAALVAAVGGSVAGALVAAVLYAFNPLRVHAWAQIQVLTDYAVPLAFLCLHRLRTGGGTRALVALAAMVGWQLLCGLYVGLFAAVPIGLLAAWELVRGGARRPGPGGVLLAALVGAAIVLPCSWPYLWLRAHGELEPHVANAIALSSGLGDLVCVRGCSSWFGPGFLPVAAALAAVALWPGGPAALRRTRTTWVVTALAAVAMALGPFVRAGAGADGDAAPRFLGAGPFFLLHRLVPGFDGIRVPARALALHHLALAVLAGLGGARLLAHVRRGPARWVLGTALVALAGAAVGRPPMTHEPLAAMRAGHPLYRWLAGRPQDGPLVELPIGRWDDAVMYHSRVHRRPLVNGYSGVLPTSYRWLASTLACYPCAAALDALAAVGVRTHVLHLGLMAPAEAARLRDAVEATPGLRVVRRFGESRVVRLAPRPRAEAPPALAALPRTGWTATSSRGPRAVGAPLDGALATYWSSAPALEDLDGARTGSRLLRGLRSWAAFFALIPHDAAWWSVDLGAARRVRRLSIAFSQSGGGSVPPAPAVEASDDGVRWTALPSAAAVRPSPADLVLGPTAVRYEYDWPATAVRHLRLRQPGFWRLHEVALAE